MSATQPDRPKERRVTIVDVAKHAGVSTAAASKALRNAYGVSDSMKERVQKSIDELNYRPYRPARGMRGHTYSIGMVVSDIENPFFNLLSDGVISVLSKNGYELLIAPGGYTSAAQIEAMDALIDHQMDGLILVAPVVGSEHIESIARRVPVVAVGQHSKSDSHDSVAGDDRLGAHLVVDHLVELGHRRMAYVGNAAVPYDPHRPESVRQLGFQEAMTNHGIGEGAIVVEGSWSMDGGRDAVSAIAALEDPPTAVFAGADVVAFGMLTTWWENGVLVPEHISLVGYDNSKTAALGPISLTTVDQSGHTMGARAGELLLERIAGRTESVHDLLEPRLVARATTARPA